MKGLRFVLPLASLAILFGVARAQGPDEPYSSEVSAGSDTVSAALAARRAAAGVPLAGAIDPAQYRLGPGDVLRLEFGGPASGSRDLGVDSEGRIRVPSMGVIPVAGKTLADVRRTILQGLKQYFPRAVLDLRLLTPRTFKVFVIGEVRNPGMTVVTGSARVTEALNAVGGLTPQAGSRNVQVLHQDNSAQRADLEQFRWTGDWDSNPFLSDGDRVVVPTATERIGVFGAVARPGWIEYAQGDSLSSVVRLLGGALPNALLGHVLLLRFRDATTLDSVSVSLDRVMAGSAPDVALLPDDRVYIATDGLWHASWHVTVEGEVVHPGVYAIHEGVDRMGDLLKWAGGFTPSAARKNVQLIRWPNREGQDFEFDRLSKLSRSEMTESEYNAFRAKLTLRQSIYLVDFSSGAPATPAADVTLRDGDVIRVSRIELAVRVDGSVEHPGLIAFEEGRSVREYLKLAGGPTTRANLSQTELTRFGTNEPKPAGESQRIEPGDFIWVPEKKESSIWPTVKDVIAAAGQVAAVYLLLDTIRH